jgi:hypothetical protein
MYETRMALSLTRHEWTAMQGEAHLCRRVSIMDAERPSNAITPNSKQLALVLRHELQTQVRWFDHEGIVDALALTGIWVLSIVEALGLCRQFDRTASLCDVHFVCTL